MDNKIIKHTKHTKQIKKKETELNLFYNSSPSNFITGILQGIYNITIGVTTGIVGIFAVPIYYSKKEGVKGFFKGGAFSLLTLICMSIAGGIYGLSQICKGIYNTNSTIQNKRKGKIWDKRNSKWIYYNLAKEKEELSLKTEEDYIILDNNNSVKETDLYDILEIESNATDKIIKKQYYILAKKTHPDRSKDNAEKFKKINEAYQVLSNPISRDKYNKFGKDGIMNESILDSNQFYQILFGTLDLNFYIGDIILYTLLVSNNNNEKISELLEFKQSKREVLLADNMLKLLNSSYTTNNNNNNKTKFYEVTRNNITLNSLSCMLVNFIGNLYYEIGNSYLTKFSNIKNFFIRNFRYIRYKCKYLSVLVKNKENEDNMLSLIINLLLEDIENTILKASNKIFQDYTTSLEKKKEYANGLIFIGNIFKKTKYDIIEIKNYLKTIINHDS